jgi:hypothetical protein
VSSLPARLLATSVVAASLLLGLDASSRDAREALLHGPAASAAALLLAWCAAIALALAVTAAGLDLLARGLVRLRARGGLVVAVVGGMAFAATLLDTARWTFAGHQIQRGWLGTYGPFVALAAATVFGALAAGLGRWAERGAQAGRKREATAVAAVFVLLAAAAMTIDHLVYVGLYDRIHRALEMVAVGLFVAAGALLLGPWSRASRGVRGAIWVLSRLAIAVVVAVALSPVQRDRMEDALSHLAPAPRLVARSMVRLKSLEAMVRGEAQGGLGRARIDELLDRYDVPAATRNPKWDEPFREAPIVAEAADRFRDDKKEPSVVIFYVDTLRRDIAYDPEIMPNLAAFAKESVVFDRAYSSGSDTLTALPTILGGHFDRRREKDPEPDEAAASAAKAATRRAATLDRETFLDLSRERGVPTTLFISESAWEFLEKLMPSFRFDEVERVRDYEKAGVWGYGAEQATTDAIVTRALDWMHDRKEKGRFLSWIFSFDVHNWREIDNRTIASTAERFGVPDEGLVHHRYRVMARSVDAAFGRLVEGLREMEMEDDVVVLFVSDHGEGLGREDFWVHSIFLWESLIRVPLVLRAPGLPPAVVNAPVGLVDVAPTLARYLHPAPSMNGYHGEDLVTYLVPDRPPRRLPLLLSSTNEQRLSRVGLIDGSYKLVLRADWGEPQLFDLSIADPDLVDFGETLPVETTRRMADLLQSPVFVNAYDDAKAVAAREAAR